MAKICINIAWPYANGPIHLGHVAGSLLPPDIFRRYNLLMGNEVLVVGGSDQYGTPITVTAEREGVEPEVIAERYHGINSKAIADLGIGYSLFSKTHCDVHTEVVHKVFNDLLAKGHLYTAETAQYHCAACDRFLPDRYVEGRCPECGAEDVRSDQCDSCGTTFEPGDLEGPRCIHCGGRPEVRPSEQFFLRLSAFEDRLKGFIAGKDHWRANVEAFTANWLEGGLRDRAITRDMTWGVPIPVEGWEDKVIYVWFEAVIGYLSASVAYSRMVGRPDLWEEYWKDPEVRHYYFVGKDNIPFHSIIWPAMLMGVGDLNLPYDIPANEYLMFRGGKLSKSRGGAIDVPSVLQEHDVDAVRYYLSINMPDTHDTDFSWEDFRIKVNNELVAALGNYYHRCLSFTHKNFGAVPAADGDGSPEVTAAIAAALDEYGACMAACDFKKGLKAVMELARYGNRRFDAVKPWALIKSDRTACGQALNDLLRLVRALCVMAWPFMPSSSERIWAFLGYDSPLEAAGFDLLPPLPAGQAMPEPVPVYRKEEVPREEPDAEPPAPGPEPAAPFAAFRRLDIRVGRIVSVEDHPDADKLYLLKADVGEEEPRQIVAGLKAFYDRDGMQDRPVLVVTNLKPAKIRGIKSTGMLLAADDEDLGGDSVLLLEPAPGAEPGTRYASGFDAASSRIDYKEFQQVRMAVSAVSGGRPTLADTAAPLPDGAPERIILVIDGEAAVPLGDGDGGMATVARPMPDGAGVR